MADGEAAPEAEDVGMDDLVAYEDVAEDAAQYDPREAVHDAHEAPVPIAVAADVPETPSFTSSPAHAEYGFENIFATPSPTYSPALPSFSPRSPSPSVAADQPIPVIDIRTPSPQPRLAPVAPVAGPGPQTRAHHRGLSAARQLMNIRGFTEESGFRARYERDT